jgi:hypothetical protein
MNIIEFATLTQDQQLDFISDTGVRLSQRLDEEHTITLYGMEGFFVELFFNKRKFGITHLSAFRSAALPEVYYEMEDFITNWNLHFNKNNEGHLPNQYMWM